ncbi:MAG: NTP transferase domain-containing protein [Puniceicoccales bacterium]|jgi:glucose-1-phosphate thymidylyltransferase|nr:NTP transferase domain-containing protein [Puniceicoccales bacterium]
MKKISKGIILAGGNGSRLYPLTLATSKQLFPLYNKPVLYYPLTTLMLAGIRDILIISTERDLPAIKNLLGTGEQFGIQCSYKAQTSPRGLPEAFILAENFLQGQSSFLILGDNFFYGHQLSSLLEQSITATTGAHLFLHPVDNPSAYGVLETDANGCIKGIIEKPTTLVSNLAITGLYIFDEQAPTFAKQLKPSARGELEITDLIKHYWKQNQLTYSMLGRGYVWYDVGTPQSLLQVGNYVEILETRQGLFIASPEEIALRLGYITLDDIQKYIDKTPQCTYRHYLENLIHYAGHKNRI